jgi:hypothetical protein
MFSYLSSREPIMPIHDVAEAVVKKKEIKERETNNNRLRPITKSVDAR